MQLIDSVSSGRQCGWVGLPGEAMVPVLLFFFGGRERERGGGRQARGENMQDKQGNCFDCEVPTKISKVRNRVPKVRL